MTRPPRAHSGVGKPFASQRPRHEAAAEAPRPRRKGHDHETLPQGRTRSARRPGRPRLRRRRGRREPRQQRASQRAARRRGAATRGATPAERSRGRWRRATATRPASFEGPRCAGIGRAGFGPAGPLDTGAAMGQGGYGAGVGPGGEPSGEGAGRVSASAPAPVPQYWLADASLFVANAGNAAQTLANEQALAVQAPSVLGNQAQFLLASTDRALSSLAALEANAEATHPRAVAEIRAANERADRRQGAVPAGARRSQRRRLRPEPICHHPLGVRAPAGGREGDGHVVGCAYGAQGYTLASACGFPRPRPRCRDRGSGKAARRRARPRRAHPEKGTPEKSAPAPEKVAPPGEQPASGAPARAALKGTPAGPGARKEPRGRPAKPANRGQTGIPTMRHMASSIALLGRERLRHLRLARVGPHARARGPGGLAGRPRAWHGGPRRSGWRPTSPGPWPTGPGPRAAATRRCCHTRCAAGFIMRQAGERIGGREGRVPEPTVRGRVGGRAQLRCSRRRRGCTRCRCSMPPATPGMAPPKGEVSDAGRVAGAEALTAHQDIERLVRSSR